MKLLSIAWTLLLPKDIRQEDCAQVGVERLWWSFYLVWRLSWQEIPGSFSVLSPPPPNYRLLLANTVINPVSIGSHNSQTSFQSSSFYIRALGKHCFLKCRHPHCVALSFYKVSLAFTPVRICWYSFIKMTCPLSSWITSHTFFQILHKLSIYHLPTLTTPKWMNEELFPIQI